MINNTNLRLLTGLCAPLICSVCWSQPSVDKMTADAIYTNASIWTGNMGQPWASSMVISDGTIIAIGADKDLAPWRDQDIPTFDLAGHFVTPGFQDSHLHMMYIASPQVDLAGAETLEEMQQRILEFAKKNPDLPWITGFGWGYSVFPDRRPMSVHLDSVVTDRPVFVKARDGHMALANTMAMSLGSISEDTPDPENGRIVRTATGTATGELQEDAMKLVERLIPPPTEEQRYGALRAAMKRAAAEGLTTTHEAGVSEDDVEVFKRAEREGELLQRVELALRMVKPQERAVVPIDAINSHINEATALREQLQGPFVRVRSIKGMLDGTVDAATAAMFENFVGTNTAGLPFWDSETLNAVVAMYDKAGFQILLHAIGDRAIADALDSFAYASSVNNTTGRRHRIEHAEVPRPRDLIRFRELGVTASTQAMFAYPDDTVLNNFSVLLGPRRAQHADNFALWDRAGIRQVFGSDYPVMTLSVLQGIETAATRMTELGTPAGGWYPGGRIPVEAALRHYTSDSAWGIHDEKTRGSLEVGKFADFVVLSENLLEIDPSDISEVSVLQTVMHGRTTFLANSD